MDYCGRTALKDYSEIATGAKCIILPSEQGGPLESLETTSLAAYIVLGQFKVLGVYL